MSLLQRFKNTFLPSAEVGAQRRQAVFGTTSKIPPIILASSIFPVGRLLRGAGAVASGIRPAVASVGRLATTKTGALLQGARNLYQTALGNPLASGGLRGFATRIGGRLLGGLGLAYGSAFAQASITGDDPNINVRRLAYGSLGFGLGGPIGFGIGSLIGTAKNVGRFAQDQYHATIGSPTPFSMPNIPAIPNIPNIPNIPTLPEVGFPGMGGSLSATYSSSLSPQMNVGSGGGLSPELIALLVAVLGVAGARAYLKRKKKKKRKKRKK